MGCQGGVFSLEKSLEVSKISKFSRISRKWFDSPLFSTVWGSLESLESLESLNSLESLENGLSEKTPFPKDPFFRSRNTLHWGYDFAKGGGNMGLGKKYALQILGV